jgi:hypothetical protein
MADFRYSKLLISLAASFLLLSAPAYAQSAFEDPGLAATDSSGGSASKGTDLVAVKDKIEGGAIALGSSSQVVLLFRNDSAKPIVAGDISLYPSSNVSAQVSQNQCSLTPLDVGAVCAIALNTKGLQAGKYRIEILVKHDGRSRLLTSTITGDVEASADQSNEVISDVEANPSELDFGDLSESQTMVRSVVLRNITSNPINISDVRIEANDQSGFNLQTTCAKLETGQACIATVSWAPQKKGDSSGILIIEHDGPTGVASIPLDGSYDPSDAEAAKTFPEAVPGKGLLISTTEEIEFGDNISTSSAITISLVNIGDVPLTLQDLRLSNNENGVEVGRSGCKPGTVLSPVEACALTLTWSPVREGAIIDDIQIRHNGARGILVLPVRGSAAKAVNKDSKAIVLNNGGLYLGGIPSLLTTDLLDDEVIKPGASTPSGDSQSSDDKDGAAPSGTDGDSKGSSSSSGGSSSSATPASYGGSAQGGTSSSGPRQATKAADVQGILDGFAVTSLASNRAVITGPGGSRVVFDGEESIIAGVLWSISVKNSAVEFGNGNQKVLMLFDKSLSSVNRAGGQSGSGSTSSVSSSTASSTPSQ